MNDTSIHMHTFLDYQWWINLLKTADTKWKHTSFLSKFQFKWNAKFKFYMNKKATGKANIIKMQLIAYLFFWVYKKSFIFLWQWVHSNLSWNLPLSLFFNFKTEWQSDYIHFFLGWTRCTFSFIVFVKFSSIYLLRLLKYEHS